MKKEDVVGGMLASQEVFADKEEIKEVRVGLRHEVIPGDGNSQKQQDPGHVEEFQEEFWPPGKHGVPKEDAYGKGDGDEPFGQHAKAHGGIKEEKILLLFRPLKEVKGDQAGVDKEGQGHIEDANGSDDQLQGRRSQDDGCHEARSTVVHRPAQDVG